jgi:cell division FtsZ-interacting protein ZapD
MNNIDQLATYRALGHIRASGGIDHFLRIPEVAEQLGLKRIQFEARPELVAQLENACVMLDVSKREFLESALVDAIERAEQKFLAVYREATGEDFKG